MLFPRESSDDLPASIRPLPKVKEPVNTQEPVVKTTVNAPPSASSPAKVVYLEDMLV